MKAKVYGISLPPPSSRNLFDSLKIKDEINHIICDIRNKEQLNKHINEIKPDIIFHLAAQPLVIKSYLEPIQTWETNVIGTLNILNSITLLDNACIGVFITTDKVYKNNEWAYGYREIDPLEVMILTVVAKLHVKWQLHHGIKLWIQNKTTNFLFLVHAQEM